MNKTFQRIRNLRICKTDQSMEYSYLSFHQPIIFFISFYLLSLLISHNKQKHFFLLLWNFRRS